MREEPSTDTIAAWATEVAGWPEGVRPVVSRLDGGFSWQTYRVANADEAVIVRVAPGGGTVEPYDPHAESSALQDAAAAGLPVAAVLAVDDGHRFGTPAAVHTALDGVNVRPGAWITDEVAYRTGFASALATIHRDMPSTAVSVRDSYLQTIEEEVAHYRRAASCAHPGFELAWQWLVANVPMDDRPAVRLHGDYRLANLLWSAPGRLSGVLDWERSRSGDPMCDVAFSRIFSGWCAIDGEAAEIYSSESGIEVDEARIEYATVFERWRSFTSAMRGLAAFVEGRNPDRRLIRIGLAGEAGAWRFVRDLPASGEWDRSEMPGATYQSRLLDREGAEWPELADADRHALTRAFAELGRIDMPGFTADFSDPAQLFAGAHAWAMRSLAAGHDVREALQALALRATLRFQLLEEHGWH